MKPYNLESFVFVKNVFVMKSLTDFRKMVEASVDRSATGIDTSVGSRGDDEWGKKSRRKDP